MKRALWLMIVVLGGASNAWAGNLDAVFVSDQASMMGGAVTAITSDTGAAFYNPAGLALDTSYSSISLSASSYGFAFRSRSLLEVTSTLEGTLDDLSSLQLVTVPAAVASYFPLNEDVGVGLGLFAPGAVNEWLRNAADVTDPATGTTNRLVFEERLQASQLYIGGGVGFRVSDELRVGASLFGVYSVQSLHLDVSGYEPDEDGFAGGLAFSDNIEGSSFGLRPIVGVQWEPLPCWIMGATVQLPSVQLLSESAVSIALFTFEEGEAPVALNPFERGEEEVTGSLETRILAGVGYRSERTRFGLEASYQLADPDVEQTRDVWNARVGIKQRVSDFIWLGGGLFTDRSSLVVNPEDVGATYVDFYGITFGVRAETHYLARLVGDYLGEAPSGDPTRLVFFTSLTGRYAYGTGTAAQLTLGSNAAGVLETATVAQELAVHEFAGQLSTGVVF